MQTDQQLYDSRGNVIALALRAIVLAGWLALVPGAAVAQNTDVQRMIDNNNRKLDDLSRSQTLERERILDNTSIRRQLENSRDNEAIGRPRLPNCPPGAAGC